MIAFTCPHCGGSVRYDLASGSVKCEYCDGLITQDDYETYLDKKGLYQTTELSCPQCGGVVLSYDNTLATFCSYCGSSVVFDRRVREEQKPSGMIPFSLEEETALANYRKKTDRILLAPEWIREEGRQEMTGIYMPFYLYKASCEQPVSVKQTKSRSIGRRTEVSVYEVDGTLKAAYRGVRFDAALAFPDAMSESVDSYDWKREQPFRPGYVAGYYADGSDVEAEEYDPIVRQLVSDDLNNSSSISGIQLEKNLSIHPDHVAAGRKKILLPVWLLTHRVRDRICYAAVNGQNGDVAADIPLDRGKYIKVSVIVTALIATLMNFGLTIKPEPFLTVSMILTAVFGIVLGRLTQDVYIRENHLDDIGLVGYAAFADAVKNIDSAGKKRPKPLGCSSFVIYGVVLFFVWPFVQLVVSELFPSFTAFNLTVLAWPVIVTVLIIRFFSGVFRQIGSNVKGSAGRTNWKYSRSLAAAFSVLWKVWLALAAGALVLMSGTVEDLWYYGAGALNILVCIWASFDVISKQNKLASRDIPVFTMKRGGRE